MREQIIRDIRSYLRFLEASGYAVSLSFLQRPFLSFAVELMQYDFHPHSVCNYLKQNPGTEGRCIRNKAAVKKRKLKSPCYAGVEEFLLPLSCEGNVLPCFRLQGRSGSLRAEPGESQVRLNNAKRLLRSTDRSVTEIAFSVGFADSNYFSSFFKKQEGQTPREYRNSKNKWCPFPVGKGH